MSNDFDNHILITSSKDIAEVCKPLLTHFDITTFDYAKIYPDGSQIKLATNPDWMRFYYNHRFQFIGDFETPKKHFQSGYRLTSLLHSPEIFKAAEEYFDIAHGLVLVEEYKDFTELFWFATRKENIGIVGVYLNNMDMLKHFTLYFREKVSKLIEKADKQRILMPNHKFVIDENPGQTDKIKKSFIEAIKIKHYRMRGEYSNVLLTEREFECAICALEGKTAKESAKKLYISPKTVETHLGEVKTKLNCNTRSEMVALLLKNGFGIYASEDIIFY